MAETDTTIRAWGIGDNSARAFSAWLAATAVVGLCAMGPAAAETGRDRLGSGQRGDLAATGPRGAVRVAQAGQRRFDLPPQALSSALTLFGRQSGLQVAADTETVSGLRTRGVRGTYTPEQALRLLLAGTGLQYSYSGANTVTLHGTITHGVTETQRLDTVNVEGAGETESAFGPVDGYVATRSATGTKTDTPLIETPQSITVIPRDRLDAQDADTINKALRYTPGVIGEVFGNDSRVDFLQYRGFDEGGTGVFRDGLQLRSSAFAEFRPDLYGAERVEILRGPASVLYGQGTPGGVVNIVSKRPRPETFAEVQLDAGSFDHFEGKFDVGGALAGSERVFFRMTGLARESDTQVDFVKDDRLFLAPALTVQPSSKTTLTILGYYQDDETGSTNQFLPSQGTLLDNVNGTIPVSRFTGEPDFEAFDRTTYAIGYLFEHRPNDVWTIRQNARYDTLDVDYETVFGGGLAADLRTLNRFSFTALGKTDLFTIDTHAQAKFTTGAAEHTFLVGVDYQYYDVSDTQGSGGVAPIDIFNPVYGALVTRPALFTDTTIVQKQVGIYAQEQLKLFDRLVLTLGGRQDFVSSELENRLASTTTDQDDSEFSWRAGAVYLFDGGLAPYASYTRSFLPIVGTDRNSTPFVPETGEQYEAGIKYQPPGSNSSVTVSAFHLTRQNVRTTDPNDPFNQIQTGEVRSKGIEIEGIASLASGLDLIASYSFQDVEITKSNRGDQGNRPTSVPEHLASLWLDYTIQDGPLAGLGFGAGVRYKGSTFGDAANTLEVDDYVLVDATVHYSWEKFRFAVNAENVFDNRHVAGCSGVNACFYGVDRTVKASLRYRW